MQLETNSIHCVFNSFATHSFYSSISLILPYQLNFGRGEGITSNLLRVWIYKSLVVPSDLQLFSHLWREIFVDVDAVVKAIVHLRVVDLDDFVGNVSERRR
jgi:hypothetical protein